MKALNLPVSRHRQVVILTGVRPGAKLQTTSTAARRVMSPLASFALTLTAALAAFAATLLLFVSGHELAGAGILLAALVTIVKKGGTL